MNIPFMIASSDTSIISSKPIFLAFICIICLVAYIFVFCKKFNEIIQLFNLKLNTIDEKLKKPSMSSPEIKVNITEKDIEQIKSAVVSGTNERENNLKAALDQLRATVNGITFPKNIECSISGDQMNKIDEIHLICQNIKNFAKPTASMPVAGAVDYDNGGPESLNRIHDNVQPKKTGNDSQNPLILEKIGEIEKLLNGFSGFDQKLKDIHDDVIKDIALDDSSKQEILDNIGDIIRKIEDLKREGVDHATESMEQQKVTLSAKIDELTGANGQLKTERDQLKERVGSLEGELQTLKDNYGEIESNMARRLNLTQTELRLFDVVDITNLEKDQPLNNLLIAFQFMSHVCDTPNDLSFACDLFNRLLNNYYYDPAQLAQKRTAVEDCLNSTQPGMFAEVTMTWQLVNKAFDQSLHRADGQSQRSGTIINVLEPLVVSRRNNTIIRRALVQTR